MHTPLTWSCTPLTTNAIWKYAEEGGQTHAEDAGRRQVARKHVYLLFEQDLPAQEE